LQIDADLRWSLVLRLVRLRAFGAAEIDAELAGDKSTEGVSQAARCRAALPDGKEEAWARIMTETEIGVKELFATCEGFWHPAQADVTAPYVERFFAEIADRTEAPHTLEGVPPRSLPVRPLSSAGQCTVGRSVTSWVWRPPWIRQRQPQLCGLLGDPQVAEKAHQLDQDPAVLARKICPSSSSMRSVRQWTHLDGSICGTWAARCPGQRLI
jgi:hypothetical protein